MRQTESDMPTMPHFIPPKNDGSNYDRYELWKGWDQDNFAKLDALSEATISEELGFLPSLPSKETSILEIGFGHGTFLAYARKYSWKILGIEINEKLIQLATEAGFTCKRNDELEKIQDETFDLIVAFDILEHIPHTDILKLLSNIRRLLKPEGCFIARFPNGDSPFSLPLQNGDPTHLNHIGSGKVKFYARTLGFELLYVGASALPTRKVGVSRSLHRIITFPFKRLLNLMIRLIFFPTTQLEFISPNLTVVFKKVVHII